jgi:hypothetical protein
MAENRLYSAQDNMDLGSSSVAVNNVTDGGHYAGQALVVRSHPENLHGYLIGLKWKMKDE